MRSIHYWLSVGSFSLVDSNFAWRSRRGNFQDNYSSEELNTKKSARLTLILWYLYWLKKGWRSIFREIEGTEGFCLMRDSIEPTPKERRNENREKNQWKREAFHSVWLPILIFDSPKRALLQKNERIRKKTGRNRRTVWMVGSWYSWYGRHFRQFTDFDIPLSTLTIRTPLYITIWWIEKIFMVFWSSLLNSLKEFLNGIALTEGIVADF